MWIDNHIYICQTTNNLQGKLGKIQENKWWNITY